MALPRFKPDYVWTDKDWANLPIKGSDLAAELCAAGYTVLGVTNGKPELQEKISDTELQQLVIRLLRGEASPAPSPISETVPEKEHKAGKKKSK